MLSNQPYSSGRDTDRSYKEDQICERCQKEYMAAYLERRKPKSSDGRMLAWIEESLLQPDSCQLCTILKEASDDAQDPFRGYEENKLVSLFSLNLNGAEGLCFALSPKTSLERFLVPKNISVRTQGIYSKEAPWARELDKERVNYNIAKEWINFCRRNHGATCANASKYSLSGFRVIDCKTRKVHAARPDLPYIALSYVWGPKPAEPYEYRDELPNRLPQTVEDAMLVAVNLGIPSLWVDRYCIDQKNPVEKRQLITNMDRIYSGAEVTIIAAVGHTPDYGLPGVSDTSRKPQQQVSMGGHAFISIRSLKGEKEKSKWWTRGWTYQEMLLSRRRLVFWDSQMYFQCRAMHCLEAISPYSPALESMRPAGSSYWSSPFYSSDKGPFPTLFPKGGIGTSPYDIYVRLREYYQRELSFDQDALNAFEGIFNAFRSLRGGDKFTHHFWGIPMRRNSYIFDRFERSELATFTEGLAWSIRLPRESPIQRREGAWPSWTWAALKGGSLDFIEKPWTFLRQETLHIVVNPQDNTSPFPWIDISSWVLTETFVDVTPDASIQGIKDYFPWEKRGFLDRAIISAEDMEKYDTISAVYLGTTGIISERDGIGFYSSKSEIHFLLVKQRDDGCFRRVGTAKYELDYLLIEEVVVDWAKGLTWLPGPASDGLNDWEFRTLRLV